MREQPERWTAETWVGAAGFSRRPIVVVEDHLYHIGALLQALEGAPQLTAALTVVCLDRPGPDTARAVHGWLAAHPAVQVVAPIAVGDEDAEADGAARLRPLAAAVFGDATRLCRAVARLLRPGGLLLQDVQLETLGFIPADRWWESIYLASTVRGMFAQRPPACRFLSNKRGYEATFGRDLMDAGFDPRDVIDKNRLAEVVVPMLQDFVERRFPFTLETVVAGDHRPATAIHPTADRAAVEAALDLVIWQLPEGTVELGGRACAADRCLTFKPGSHEATTWHALVDDRFAAGTGVPVRDVGHRVAPEHAGRAERSNAAARHIHTLRSRLQDASALLTVDHTYRLGDALRLGRARLR